MAKYFGVERKRYDQTRFDGPSIYRFLGTATSLEEGRKTFGFDAHFLENPRDPRQLFAYGKRRK